MEKIIEVSNRVRVKLIWATHNNDIEHMSKMIILWDRENLHALKAIYINGQTLKNITYQE